jgi:hypothetical protein
MRRLGAEPEPKCGSKVREASLQADEAVRNLHTKCPSLELESLMSNELHHGYQTNKLDEANQVWNRALLALND